MDIKSVDSLLEFNNFLEEDPKVSLQKTGIYDFIKQSWLREIEGFSL